MENNNLNLESLGIEELSKLFSKISDLIDEREEADRKAKLAEKLPLIEKFRKQWNQINKAYQNFDGLFFTERVTLTFRIGVNVSTAHDNIAQLGDEPDASDLFNFNFNVSVTGNYNDKEVNLITDHVDDLLHECEYARRILMPKLQAKFQKLLGEYAELVKQLAANQIDLYDLDSRFK